jgi:hypothetical protein
VVFEERNRAVLRVDKTLQDAVINVASAASNLSTKSGRVIWEA